MQRASELDTVPSSDAFPDTVELPAFGDTPPEQPAGNAPAPHPVAAVTAQLQKELRRSRLHRRLLIGCGFAGLYLFALFIFCLVGLVNSLVLVASFGFVVTAALVFFALYAASKSKRKAEKRLTGPIAVSALAVMLADVYFAPGSRPVFTTFVFLAIAYGMYYMSRRAMLLLCAGTLAGFGAVIGAHHVMLRDAGLLREELLGLFLLGIALPGFVLLAGRVRQLHSALYKAGLKIKNIEESARRDPLLGCYNRRFMVAALEEQKRLADLNGTPLCLAVIDLDHFKRINDEVGHLAGDEVLRRFANVARQNIRQFDVFGRYGGEEFLLILPHTPLAAAFNTVERIRDRVEKHQWSEDLKAPVTVSIGLTQYSGGESALDLFSRTDTAMYLAKRGGRNQVSVQEPHVELWHNTLS
ncbi:MAG TPA: GGDEF domain-containing protein [Burkholderiaceae bacterium]